MEKSAGLNIFQQVYVQTFAAGTAGQVVGPAFILQRALDKLVDTLIKNTLRQYGWRVTWGPRVWKASWNPLEALDNAWFAAECENVEFPDGKIANACVVAIAGTATFSLYDWFVEDFGVDKVVQYDDWSTTWTAGCIPRPTIADKPCADGAYAALGTCIGVYQILTNSAPGDRPGHHTTLAHYLSEVPDTTRIIFTGHSLGGCLAPAVAYGLKNAGIIKGDVFVLPVAGASPGNKPIATGYMNDFRATGTGSYQVWNSNLYNTLDIVPQAWCIGPKECADRNLQRIPTIYGPLEGKVKTQVDDLINIMKKKASSSGIAYYPIEGNAFTGLRKSLEPPHNLRDFMLEVTRQHTAEYYKKVKLHEAMKKLYYEFANSQGIARQTLLDTRHQPVAAFLLKLLLFSLPFIHSLLPQVLFVELVKLLNAVFSMDKLCPYQHAMDEE